MNRIRRGWFLLLALLLCLCACGAQADAYVYEKTGEGTVYNSPTLRYSIEVGQLDGRTARGYEESDPLKSQHIQCLRPIFYL